MKHARPNPLSALLFGAALLGGALSPVPPGLAAPPPAAPAHSRAPQGRAPADGRTVILTPREARGGMLGVDAGSYWAPTRADVRRLEADLRRLPPVGGAPLPPDILGYYRQYVGVVVGGRRMIYVNGFSASVALEFTGGRGDWRHHPVFVNDGGRDFFHVTYDVGARRFRDFGFNGEA